MAVYRDGKSNRGRVRIRVEKYEIGKRVLGTLLIYPNLSSLYVEKLIMLMCRWLAKLGQVSPIVPVRGFRVDS